MSEIHDELRNTSLETLIAQWPVVDNLSHYLPVGDLISLARANNTLRTSLHGFDQSPSTNPSERKDLYLGQHGTTYWQRLKAAAPVSCSSKTHTKGPNPRPCRYCSKPICEACIVRSSFAKRNENTFKNRYRYLCKICWESGNVSKSHRFPLEPGTTHGFADETEENANLFCTCTLKNDGWLCLECKDRQNTEANTDRVMQCHGQGCTNLAGDDHANRRICQWCERILPRQVGGSTRLVWNQKLIEARARNAASRQADMEEYNRKRLKQMRMSRREMRGDNAVKNDPQADAQVFIRHFDVVNYRRFMPEAAVPGGSAVYESKRGYWRYNREFLLQLGKSCKGVQCSTKTAKATVDEALPFVRTNAIWNEEFRSMSDIVDKAFGVQSLPRKHRTDHLKPGVRKMYDMQKYRMSSWHHHKPIILHLARQKNLSAEEVRSVMLNEHDFSANAVEYQLVLKSWEMNRNTSNVFTQKQEMIIQSDEDVPSSAILFKAAVKSGPESEAAQLLTAKCIFEHVTSLQEESLNRSNSRNSIATLSSLQLTNSRTTLAETDDDFDLANHHPVGSAPEAWDSAFTDSSPSISPASEENQASAREPFANDDNVPQVGYIAHVPPDGSTVTEHANQDDPPPYAPGIWSWHDQDNGQGSAPVQDFNDVTLEVGGQDSPS